MSKSMYMFDDVDATLDPLGAYAYAGYVDGKFANFPQLQKMFPKAHLLSITVFGNKADCIDVEPGDANNAQVYGWFIAMQDAGVRRPCIYTAAYNMAPMQATMKANGFSRMDYRLWSAHYTDTAHFCAPNTCGYGLDQADATQFTDRALGKSLDESVVADDFFGPAPVNPVTDLHVAKRGFTSMRLQWHDSPGASSYSVHTFYRGKPWGEPLTVTDSVARVGHLLPGHHTYTFKVRAHPGSSEGADARVNGTTR